MGRTKPKPASKPASRPTPTPAYDWKCLRCGHKWRSRVPPTKHTRPPVSCARCRSPYWNRKPATRKKFNHDAAPVLPAIPDKNVQVLQDAVSDPTRVDIPVDLPLPPPPSMSGVKINTIPEAPPMSDDEYREALKDLE